MNRIIIIIVCIFALILGFNFSNSLYSSSTINNTSTISLETNKGIVEVPLNPKRVVILDYEILDIMNNLNIRVDHLGTSIFIKPSYIEEYPSITTYDVGNLKKLDIEKIIEFKPDLIIISGRQIPYYDQLFKIAPTVDVSCNNSSYIDSINHNIRLIGKLFDKADQAELLIRDVENNIIHINSMSNVSEKGLILMAFGNKLRAYSPNSALSGLAYNACKLQTVVSSDNNRFAEGASSLAMITPEYIKSSNPKYIIVIDRDAAIKANKTKKDLLDTEFLKDVDAIKNNKVIYVDSEVWYLAGGGITATKIMLKDIENAIK